MVAKYEIIHYTEKQVYDWVSFVSEVGGALGLFLGFVHLTTSNL